MTARACPALHPKVVLFVIPLKTYNDRRWEALGPTWIEVDLDALTSNLTEIAAYVRRPPAPETASFLARHGLRPPTGAPKVMVVVKGNAYGHGAVEVARAATEAGADALGVSTLAEALELRQAGIMIPILMFNPLTPEEASVAAQAAVTATLTSLESAERLAAQARRTGVPGGLPVHVAVDTGMSRFGVLPEALPEFAQRVAALAGLRLEGLYTHFSAGSDEGPASLARMRRQLERFGRAAAAVEARGLVVPLRHAACSSAVLRLPESYLDMVRVGNLFYGFGPAGGPPGVREAWALYTRVLEVRDVPAGTGVGYGPDVTMRAPTRLATVPIGYADGAGVSVTTTTLRTRLRLKRLVQRIALWFYRHLAGSGSGGRRPAVGPPARLAGLAREAAIFLYEGEPIDIVGRISMQQTILRVTGQPEIVVGTVICVRVPRVLASPRLGRVYFTDGQAIAARTPSGLAEAAAGWDFPGPAR
jgi:alanine racemase